MLNMHAGAVCPVLTGWRSATGHVEGRKKSFNRRTHRGTSGSGKRYPEWSTPEPSWIPTKWSKKYEAQINVQFRILPLSTGTSYSVFTQLENLLGLINNFKFRNCQHHCTFESLLDIGGSKSRTWLALKRNTYFLDVCIGFITCPCLEYMESTRPSQIGVEVGVCV